MTTRKVDLTKPYAEQFGNTPIRYVQDGERFDLSGRHVPKDKVAQLFADYAAGKVAKDEPPAKEAKKPELKPVKADEVVKVTEELPDAASIRESLEGMTDKQIKTLMAKLDVGLVPAKGPGQRAKNIEAIVASQTGIE